MNVGELCVATVPVGKTVDGCAEAIAQEPHQACGASVEMLVEWGALDQLLDALDGLKDAADVHEVGWKGADGVIMNRAEIELFVCAPDAVRFEQAGKDEGIALIVDAVDESKSMVFQELTAIEAKVLLGTEVPMEDRTAEVVDAFDGGVKCKAVAMPMGELWMAVLKLR